MRGAINLRARDERLAHLEIEEIGEAVDRGLAAGVRLDPDHDAACLASTLDEGRNARWWIRCRIEHHDDIANGLLQPTSDRHLQSERSGQPKKVKARKVALRAFKE